MASQMGHLLLLLLAQVGAPPEQPPAPEAAPEVAPVEPSGELYPPPPEYVPPAAPAYRPLPLYGDKGMPELAIGAGYASDAGFLAAAGFRYFVVDGVAPGVEGTYVSGGPGYPAYGLALASLRLVPLRTPHVALALTGRGGRVFLANHRDGWGAGGEVSVILMMSAGVGLEVGYEILQLLPKSFCADLRECLLQEPVIGLRVIL